MASRILSEYAFGFQPSTESISAVGKGIQGSLHFGRGSLCETLVGTCPDQLALRGQYCGSPYVSGLDIGLIRGATLVGDFYPSRS